MAQTHRHRWFPVFLHQRPGLAGDHSGRGQVRLLSIAQQAFHFLVLHFAFANLTFAQVIPLQNPSFEDQPDFGKPPAGWFYCGNFGETPPDIHPGGFYEVELPSKDGRTYVGMVLRDNGTQEQLGQRLPQSLQPGQCYAFRIFAARSEQYASFSRSTGQPAQYTLPLKLAILGAHRHCEPATVLALSKAVMEAEWQAFDFILKASEAFDYLILSATSATGDAYNGNILIDAASPLIPCSCEEGPPKLERLGLPNLENKSLQNWIAGQQSQIRFDANTGNWEQHLFESEAGVVHYTNRYFWQIVQMIKKTSGAKLKIEYNPSTCLSAYKLAMQTALEESGLPQKSYQLKARPAMEQMFKVFVKE